MSLGLAGGGKGSSDKYVKKEGKSIRKIEAVNILFF